MKTAMIELFSTPPIELSESVICNGESITLDAGEGYDSYQWEFTDSNRDYVSKKSRFMRARVRTAPFA